MALVKIDADELLRTSLGILSKITSLFIKGSEQLRISAELLSNLRSLYEVASHSSLFVANVIFGILGEFTKPGTSHYSKESVDLISNYILSKAKKASLSY